MSEIITQSLVNNSYYFGYVLLMTTGTITFIEALTNKNPNVRHIMNIETCISVIAAFFYSKFNDKIKELGEYTKPTEEQENEIVEYRYMDWALTTPLMLLGLSLVLTIYHPTGLMFKQFLVLLILNYIMLGSGYLGETGKLNHHIGVIIGFIAFFGLFAFIYHQFIMGKKQSIANHIIFGIFVIIWSLYGVAYNLAPNVKNFMYNILDIIAKCFVGIGFWAYLVKIFD